MNKPENQDGFLPKTFIGWVGLAVMVISFAIAVSLFEKKSEPKPAPKQWQAPSVTVRPSTNPPRVLSRQWIATPIAEAKISTTSEVAQTTNVVDEQERVLNAMDLTKKGGSKVAIVRTNNNQNNQ